MGSEIHIKIKLKVIGKPKWRYRITEWILLLFEQQERKNGGVDYVLSGFAKALKNNSLNFNEGISGRDRIVSYSQISPLSISEPMTWEDLDDVFSENEIVIDGNGSRK